MAFNLEYENLPLILVFSCCIVTVNFGKTFVSDNPIGRRATRALPYTRITAQDEVSSHVLGVTVARLEGPENAGNLIFA
jgi:hypothetical protein